MSDTRLEQGLVGLFLVAWFFTLLPMLVPGLRLPALGLPLQQYFGIAAVAGWLSGNIYTVRRRKFPEVPRIRFLIAYLLGPPGLLAFLRALAPESARIAAPLAPIYACGVFAILFLVPVTLKMKSG